VIRFFLLVVVRLPSGVARKKKKRKGKKEKCDRFAKNSFKKKKMFVLFLVCSVFLLLYVWEPGKKFETT